MFYADHTYMILDHTKIDFYYVTYCASATAQSALLGTCG